MKVTLIRDAGAGERLLAVRPQMSPDVATERRRINFFSGRSLSDVALAAEQQSRRGALTLLQRAASPGVEFGLDVSCVPAVGDAHAEFQVSSGVGVTVFGHDVVLPRDLRMPVANCPIHRDGLPLPAEFQERAVITFGQLLDAGEAAPRAAILLLRPGGYEDRGNFDDASPCEEDPAQYAYEDWQLVESANLELYFWPNEQFPLPAVGPQYQNLLASTVFEAERQLVAGELLPWEVVGVPIALVAFDPDQPGQVLFVDRHAVVRSGGRPRFRRSLLAPSTGNPFLWSARMEQFIGEMSEAAGNGASDEDLAARFQFLPPVGLLPADLFQPRQQTNRFFPDNYTVEYLPVPLEQLDVVIKSCAGLAPFDRSAQDLVRVLVPVPQALYESELLVAAIIDPLFESTIAEYALRRGKWLRRRALVRDVQSVLIKAITGKTPTFPDPDPDALEPDEAIANDPLDSTIPDLTEPEAEYGTTAGPDGRVATRLEELRTSLSKNTVLETELGELGTRGLDGFIEFLQQKIREADDRVDLGFLQSQVDIYRIRQLILGTDAATRLATSPALASIARGESALATREDLANFITRVKESPPKQETTDSRQPPADTGGGAAGVREAQPAPRAGVALAVTPKPLIGDTFVSGVTIKDSVSPLIIKPVTGVTETPTLKPAITDSKLVALQTATKAIAPTAAPAVSLDTVLQKPAIIGNVLNFRTMTVAERLAEPPAADTKLFAVSTKANIVKGITELGINVDDLSLPGFRDDAEKETTLTIGELRGRDFVKEITDNKHDPDPLNSDEAGFFSAAVRTVDFSVAMLRIIEGRVQVYRNAVAECQVALQDLRTSLSQAEQRLDVIGGELAEARHDVSVARALFAEESDRIAQINQRRDQVLAQQVDFVVFHRPLEALLQDELPVRTLFPGLQEPPVPVCLKRNIPVPAELSAMIGLLRDVPAGWLTQLPHIIKRLDQPELLKQTIQHAQLRAVAKPITTVLPTSQRRNGKLAGPFQTLFQAQQQVVLKQRVVTQEFDVTTVSQAMWSTLRERALQFVSPGDLLDAGHGRIDVVQRTTEELDRIARVAACLYESLSAVPARLRLAWAERLSQYDEAINLRNLSRLPRWGEVEFTGRRDMQGLVDWLYGRVDIRRPEALAIISDVVRVCILLASHAPVDEIIAGHIAEPAPAQVGRHVTLTIDPRRVRLGMPVAIYRADQIVAHAVIEDMAVERASARIVSTLGQQVRLEQGARVRIGGTELMAGGKILPRFDL